MKRFRNRLEKLGLHKRVPEGSISESLGTSLNGVPARSQVQHLSSLSVEISGKATQEDRQATNLTGLAGPSDHPRAQEGVTAGTNLNTSGTNLSPGQTRGLRILKSPVQSSVDVIFIHGLTGDSLRTWQHEPSKTYWPTDLLPQDLPEARILSFGYDADVTKLLAGAVGQGTLRNHATALVCEYAALRQQDMPRGQLHDEISEEHIVSLQLGSKHPVDNTLGVRKVIIVGHSLGGLVTKKALCISSESAVDNERVLASDAIGLCFLGTPHGGSDIADLASMALQFLKLTKKRVNARIVSLLRPSSEVLADVQASFSHWLRRNNNRCSVACFFEEYEMPGIGMIVPQRSALIDGYAQLPIPSNHRDMPKFSAKEDIGYKRLVGQIKSMLSRSRANQNQCKTDIQPTVTTQLLAGHQDCLEALCYPDMNGRYNGIPSPADETCGWLVDHPIYNQWISSGNNVLWLLGHPGTGKSTLMKYALRRSTQSRTLHRERSLYLSFFFYNLGSELQKNSEGMLRAVLSQMLEAFPALMGKLVTIHQNLDRKPTDDLNVGVPRKSIWASTNLMEVLEDSMTLVLEHTDVWLFIDALDECRTTTEDSDDDTEEIRKLIKDLRKMLRKLKALPYSFRICCSCRHYPNIASLNDRYKIFVEDENSCDIEEYITQELTSEILPHHAGLLKHLVETISARAMGSFQWVRLVTRKIIALYLAGKNTSQILERVQDLPRHLSELYGSILSSIAEDDRSQARKLFEWACLSKAPLTLPEVRLMMNIDPQQRPTSFKDLENNPRYIEDDSQMERLIQSLSGGLAKLDSAETDSSTYHSSHSGGVPSEGKHVATDHPNINSGWVRKPDIDCLFLIHQSVKDYLMTEGFQILYGFPISNDNILAQSYRAMSISRALSHTMQEFTTSQIQVFAQYSSEVPRMIVEMATGRRFPRMKAGISLKTLPMLAEFPKFLTKTMDPRYTRKTAVERDISLLRQYYPLTELLEPLLGEAILAQVHSLLVRARLLYEHGMILQSTADIFTYAHEAKQRSIEGIEAQLISLTPNSAMQDPVTQLAILAGACLSDLPAVVSHVLTFMHGSDNHLRQFALEQAAEAGSCNVSALLLDDGRMSSFMSPFEDRKALLAALGTRHTEIVKLLLVKGANVFQFDSHLRTALYWAAHDGEEVICRMLLERGAEIDDADDIGQTPLMVAASQGHSAVCDVLISYSPNINAVDNDGLSLLSHAVQGGNMHIVRTLLFGVWNLPGAVSLTQDVMHDSGIAALLKDNVEFCKLAIRRKSIDFVSSSGINAASAACYAASSCFRLFLDFYKQDVNLTTYKGLNPLLWAVEIRNAAMVAELINRHDLDINYVCEGTSALVRIMRWPREGSSAEITRMLLGHKKVDPNLRPGSRTAMHEAIVHHVPDDSGKGATEEPIFNQPSEFVELLLGHPGVDVNIEDHRGRTPLALAASYGNIGIAQQLLGHDSLQINHRSHDGRTPLSFAVDLRLPSDDMPPSWKLRAKIVEVLLERADVDVNAQDNNRRTPLDWAEDKLTRVEEGRSDDLEESDSYDAGSDEWTDTEGSEFMEKDDLEQETLEPGFDCDDTEDSAEETEDETQKSKKKIGGRTSFANQKRNGASEGKRPAEEIQVDAPLPINGANRTVTHTEEYNGQYGDDYDEEEQWEEDDDDNDDDDDHDYFAEDEIEARRHIVETLRARVINHRECPRSNNTAQEFMQLVLEAEAANIVATNEDASEPFVLPKGKRNLGLLRSVTSRLKKHL